MTALAATIGTGNIAGVAAGIVSGGPGVLFWIWCYGFFATAIKFAEAVLGLTFREARRRGGAVGADVLPARRPESPALAMSYAVVAGIAALDDDAVHADELDRAGDEHAGRRAALGRRASWSRS